MARLLFHFNHLGGSRCAHPRALTYRLKVTLEPYENSVFDGDRRAHVMTIIKLYDQMSPDVRRALGWTPDMIAFGEGMLERDTKLYGPFDEDTVTANLLSAAKRGALSYHAPSAAPKKRSAPPNPAHAHSANGAAPAAPRSGPPEHAVKPGGDGDVGGPAHDRAV